jgi:hypothetical protein
MLDFEFAGSRARAAQIVAEWGPGFDASENVTLAGHGGSFAPPFAAVCSAIKFTLVIIAILYAICGLALWLRARLLQPSRAA